MAELYNPFDAIYANTERLRQLTANQAAGRQYAAGNYQGAANALATSGDLQGAQSLTANRQNEELRQAQAENYKSEALARQLTAQQTFLSGVTPRLKSAYDQAEQVRPGSGAGVVAQAYTNYLAPGLKARGVQDDELARYGELAKDPNTFFNTLGSIAQEKVDWSVVGGELIGHTASGKIVQRTKAGRIVTLKDASGAETTGWLDPEAAQPAQPQPPPPPPEGAVAAAPGGFDAFKAAIRGQEAPAGQAGVGVAGPQTEYGQAHGQMQVLDSTGEGTAKRLGIAWRPDLMRGTSPEAAAYQDQIGTAVARDAWQQGHGDPATAAALYFAGPNHALWGPKTRQYQQDIVSRMGAPDVAQASQQASASVPVPGFTPIVRTPPKPSGAVPFSADPARAKTFGIDPTLPGYFDAQGEPHIVKDASPTDTASLLHPETTRLLAEQFVASGGKDIPNVGYGKQGAAMRALILNQASEIAKIKGVDGFGLYARSVDLKADQMAYGQLNKTTAIVDAAEATATKAANFVVQGISGSGGTRFPLINKAIIAAKTNWGDPKAGVYVNRLGTFVDEYSKVISGGTGAAAVTDSVRQEAQRRISEASSPEQLTSIIDSMKTEMGYRSSSLHDGIETIRGRIRSATPAGQAPSQQNNVPQRFPRQRGWTNSLPPAQQKVVKSGRWNSNAPSGSQANPIVLMSKDEYQRLRPNEWFIDDDGTVAQRGND